MARWLNDRHHRLPPHHKSDSGDVVRHIKVWDYNNMNLAAWHPAALPTAEGGPSANKQKETQKWLSMLHKCGHVKDALITGCESLCLRLKTATASAWKHTVSTKPRACRLEGHSLIASRRYRKQTTTQMFSERQRQSHLCTAARRAGSFQTAEHLLSLKYGRYRTAGTTLFFRGVSHQQAADSGTV